MHVVTKYRLSFVFVALLMVGISKAQNIPQALSYSPIYSFLDELAGDGYIHLNSAIKPYSRQMIAEKLVEARNHENYPYLSKRQKDDLDFYINAYALERDSVPENFVQWTNHNNYNLSLCDPAFNYLTKDRIFKFSLRPILGMDIYASKKGGIIKRWFGAELNMDIAHHLSIWGSLRDISWNGTALLSKNYYADQYAKIDGAKLTKPGFINNLPGVQYKEANYGADFSDSKGGISAYTWWGSISLQRENIAWGDAYHSSVIMSGRAPAVPMITLNLKPCRWFEFNYFHAWLVSNVVDSTSWYNEHEKAGIIAREYRPHNKFMAANMFTFSPIPKLSFSFGNSIVYAENNVQAAYFIPIAFYKSLDHLMTKGLGVENQNSQVFFTINTRNVDHLNLYASLYVDEFKFSRLKKSNPEHNPIAFQVGFNVTNWPVANLSLKGEFTRAGICTYTHSIDVLTYASNSYYLGAYGGDNSQNIFVELNYKPVRGLSLSLSYNNDTKYNNYDYFRKEVSKATGAIGQKPWAEKTYQNDVIAFDGMYEVHPNMFMVLHMSYNMARGFAPTSECKSYEDRGEDVLGNPLAGADLEQYYLNKFCPLYLQGNNFTFMAGFSFGF